MFNSLTETFSAIFSRFTGSGTITPKQIAESFELVKSTLLEADVPLSVVTQFMHEVEQDLAGKKALGSLTPAQHIMKVVHDRLVLFLGGRGTTPAFSFQIPSVTLVLGLQGAGKTTTVAKLARFIQNEAAKRNKKRKILLCSVDFYRPAAIDQLEILAGACGVGFYRARADNAVTAAQEALAYARAHGYEHVFIDTAGRLHVDALLLQEVASVARVTKPQYVFLVLDGMIGQESLSVAEQFNKTVPLTGIIMTKMDSQARGGAAFACYYSIKKPVVFMGTGEKIDDLEQFYPERIAQRIVGMGDMQTLVERANSTIKVQDQQRMEAAFKTGKLSLDDFAQQLDMMKSLGSLSSLMRYLPGMGSVKVSPEQLEKGETEIKKFKAIMSSMTRAERLNPRLLNESRKKRIAHGSGTNPGDISLLLERFEQSQHFVKIIKRGVNPKGSFPKGSIPKF